MLSQMPRSFTTCFQFVPACEQTFWGILSWAQTLIRSFAERQLSHKVHTYLVHNMCLTHSQGTKNTIKSSCPNRSQLVSSSFITRSQMTKHMALEVCVSTSAWRSVAEIAHVNET
jgi:hypothetical protein